MADTGDPGNRDKTGKFGPGNKANPSGRPRIAHDLRMYMAEKTREDIDAIRCMAETDEDSGIRLKARCWLAEQVIGKAALTVADSDGNAMPIGIMFLPSEKLE